MISVTEIILIAAGILAVILGYLIPNGKESSEFDFDGADRKINDMVSRAIKNSQGKIDEMLDDCMEEAINKAERAMDRVTNEKMSAISEYSDTVMNDIHKNHDEVVFMYDMLNDKHKNLKNTVSEANRAAKEVKEAEAKRQAELEEEAKRQAELEAEAKRQAKLEEEARKKAQREAEARRLAELEAEAKRKAELEAEARRKAALEAEAKRQAELETEARRQAALEEQARRQAELADNPNVVTPEFSALADILDRADAAAAEKTKNKIIRSEQPADNFETEEFVPEEEDSFELHTQYWPDSDEDDFLDEITEEVTENAVLPEQNEIQNPVYADNTAEYEEKPAKVVSIADASRKKAAEPEKDEETASDPVSRNQKILEMHKAGKSAVVIARELRLGIGEVKLVIDLAGKQHKKNRTSIM
ncbi:DUF6115 domain-containing protein [Butyrivibrio sp. XPD2002]|uniref:DUF6115 domain-containing protein n=1 Tax=Butyrivibrio sp. XPD2002 TaxID=1280665 RepID=UPI00041BB127|nr:DUF6115 domain-containing protein [Butyrivibrio sp. XPD2002]